MTKSCSGGSGSSIVISALQPGMGSSNSSFYPDEASVNEDSTSSSIITAKRFLDTTANCISPNTSNTDDEDTCERASIIQFALPAGSASPYKYKCREGECIIGIGKPK
jgi:hypothetical protein